MPRRSKRGDRRFTSPSGELFDSEFEWRVYNGLRDRGYSVRRCDERDSIAYHTQVKAGRCLECDSANVAQSRIYTPDLWVVEPEQPDQGSARRGYFVECKGYFPQQRRAMLRALKSQQPALDLRFVFSSEVRLTKARTNVEYVLTMIKAPATSWDRKTNYIKPWRYP